MLLIIHGTVIANTSYHNLPTVSRIHPRTLKSGFTTAEALIAVAVFAISAVAFTATMLHTARVASITRVKTLAKAAALQTVQQALAAPYDPGATTPVIPACLTTGTTTTTITLGDSSSDFGLISGTQSYVVESVSNTNTSDIRRITCTINYKFYGKPESYQLVTYRASD